MADTYAFNIVVFLLHVHFYCSGGIISLLDVRTIELSAQLLR